MFIQQPEMETRFDAEVAILGLDDGLVALTGGAARQPDDVAVG